MFAAVLATICIMCGIGSAEEKIVICGTGDSQDLLRALAKTYEASHPGISIDVPDSIGSSGGIKATAEGKCDMGRVARAIREKEKKYELQYRVFAVSPVAIITSANVKLDNLSPEQIVDIFSGKISRWNAVGGEDAEIYVANREEGDSSLGVLKENLPGFDAITAFAGKTLYSTPETVETLSKYSNVIGYAPLAMVKHTGINVLKIDGTYPSSENVLAGRYKQVTPFGIVWKGELKGTATKFLEYLFTSEGKKIISENGAVPVR